MKFYELSKKYHPDLNQKDEEAHSKFLEINEAYSVLSDDFKRREYDRTISSIHNESAGGPSPIFRNARTSYRQRSQINPDDWIQFRRGNGTMHGYPKGYNDEEHQRAHYGSTPSSNNWTNKRDIWRAVQHGKFRKYETTDEDRILRRKMIWKVIAMMMVCLIVPDLL